ncbi:MAG: hypothetical protein K8R68_02825, partial [Bacteroidales bacterium]|nr:hypothetical protein [Bacteroidales bacterium]
QNIDALLILHDVPLYQLLQIEEVLKKLLCVVDYNISFIELRWDFFLESNAVKLQQKIIQHLHLKNATTAFRKGKLPRLTFYINSRASDAFLKIYIRPKVPNPGEQEFVRVELCVKRRWLKKLGLSKPSDFINMHFTTLTKQLVWVDINEDALGKSILNLLSAGLFKQFVLFTTQCRGIARAIIECRKWKNCIEDCRFRGNKDECPLVKEVKKEAGIGSFNVINKCEKAKHMTDFISRYCKKSEIRAEMHCVMKEAYDEWKTKREKELIALTGMKPIFPVRAHILLLHSSIKEIKDPPDFKMKSIWEKRRK